MNKEIAPSILSADFSDITPDIRKCENAGVTILHIDIMDGNFVPNITIGPAYVATLRKKTKLILDTHLMISDPGKYAELFAKAGSDWIIFHVEATKSLHETKEVIKKINSLGVKSGISINPATPVAEIEPYLNDVFVVLVMSVIPGFGGQKFMPEALSKIEQLVLLRDKNKNKFKIEVDGGVNFSTISDTAIAGADIIVAGNAVFKSEDGVEESIKKLTKLANV